MTKNLLGLVSFLSPDWFLYQFCIQLSNFFTLERSPCWPIIFFTDDGLYLSTHMRVSHGRLASSCEEMDCVLGEEVVDEGLPVSCQKRKVLIIYITKHEGKFCGWHLICSPFFFLSLSWHGVGKNKSINHKSPSEIYLTYEDFNCPFYYSKGIVIWTKRALLLFLLLWLSSPSLLSLHTRMI